MRNYERQLRQYIQNSAHQYEINRLIYYRLCTEILPLKFYMPLILIFKVTQVKYNGAIGLPTYDSILVFNSSM